MERILLAHSVVMSTGGIPLLYLGDEVGQLNDYSWMSEPEKRDDSRWVHRPACPTERYTEAQRDPTSGPWRILAGLKNMIRIRQTTDAFNGGRLVGFRTHNEHVLGYQRLGQKSVVCLANFDDVPQWVGREVFQFRDAWDLVAEKAIDLSEGIHLQSHQFVWLERA